MPFFFTFFFFNNFCSKIMKWEKNSKSSKNSGTTKITKKIERKNIFSNFWRKQNMIWHSLGALPRPNRWILNFHFCKAPMFHKDVLSFQIQAAKLHTNKLISFFSPNYKFCLFLAKLLPSATFWKKILLSKKNIVKLQWRHKGVVKL